MDHHIPLYTGKCAEPIGTFSNSLGFSFIVIYIKFCSKWEMAFFEFFLVPFLWGDEVTWLILRDANFCLISSKRLKITYLSLYKILFALSRRFDWYIIWWVLGEKNLATLNISHVTSPPHKKGTRKNPKNAISHFEQNFM